MGEEMDDVASAPAAEHSRAIEFTGDMRDYVRIAATNALLTLFTLFIYRSWAKARSRRYLWSNTRFIDDELQWTGTGKEMFIGFLFVALFLGALGLAINIGLPALAIREGPAIAFLVLIGIYMLGMFLYGLARFRGLRYRLSRTTWRGIRGGSDDGGWRYGVKAIGYYLAAFFVGGLLYPWAQSKLWNERWNKMSFGPERFEANMTSDDTRGAFFVFWFSLVIGSLVLGAVTGVMHPGNPDESSPFLSLIFYAAVGLAYLRFVTAYYQAAAQWTRIGDLEFRFTAEYKDWLKFYVTTVGLAIITLGLAMFIYDFRRWRFVIGHLEAYGTVDVDALTQSRTAVPRDAEGFLDALDIGAF